MAESFFDSIKDRLETLHGRFDFWAKRGHGLGGPLNMQSRRREMIDELMRKVPFVAIVETGTFRAESTIYFLQFKLPVHTIELSRKYYEYSRLRLYYTIGNVKTHLGHSVEVLKTLFESNALPAGPIFFYLDAHWYDDLPLRAELELIAANRSDFVAIVDDFEVPDDPGYGFDNYGPGKALNLALLKGTQLKDCAFFFPSAPSSEETGYKRGCLVIARGAAINDLKSMQSLRETIPTL